MILAVFAAPEKSKIFEHIFDPLRDIAAHNMTLSAVVVFRTDICYTVENAVSSLGEDNGK